MADNKKYYYIMLKENFFDSEEIKILESMPDGYIYSNILLKLYLRSLRNGGRLMYRNVIPYTPEVLATLVGQQVGTVEKALDIFEKLKLIEKLDNGAIYMMDIQNYIGRSSTEADRQREYYRKVNREKALLENSGESNPAVVESEKSESNSKKAISNYSTYFEKFWTTYPRKADKAQAYKKYKARLEDGFSHEQLLEAARNYAEQCRRDRTEEKYIKHGKTFLGEGTPFLDYLPKNAPVACTDATNYEENPFRKE